jgi:tetratricopeptide (TPR) repeat protein
MALKPADRYGSALDLAADVERWLADEPVTAWREPWSTRAGRWVRRHRQLATGVAAVLLAAVPLSVVIAVNSDRARQRAESDERTIRERKEVAEANEQTAKEREAETQAMLDFVKDRVLAAARPKEVARGLGSEVTLRRALETALPFVEQSFRQQPLIEARLRMTLGSSFSYQGETKIATDQFRAAHTIFAEHLGPDHPDTLTSMIKLANCYDLLGRHAEALKLNEETLVLRRAKLGPDHLDTLQSMSNVANSYAGLGRYAEALELSEQTLALQKVKLGPDHRDTLGSMSNVANNYASLGRYAEALELCEQTLALQKAKRGPHHPDTLATMYNIASIHALLVPKSTDGAKEADLAMDWLKRAVAAGFNYAGQIKQDTDLDVLRGREDFKKLLADLEASREKGKK